MEDNLKEQQVFAPKDGKPGYLVNKGKPNERWVGIDVKGSDPAALQRQLSAYAARRGATQIQQDIEKLQRDRAAAQQTPPPDQKPATAKPQPAPSRPAPAPTPFGRTMPAPAAADLDKYKINKDWAAANPRLAQAQVARASGQPRADINKILYKPGTTAYGAAGKSEMEKQVDQMRQDREKMVKQREADKIGPRAQSALPGGAYSPTATANMTQRTKNILGVKEQYDAYDLVLEYLFSQGHVETLEEALYVMMEMSSKTIQSIVEGVMPEPINPEVHRRLQRIEKATKLQQGTTGAESQSAGSAVKRMGGSGVQLPGV